MTLNGETPRRSIRVPDLLWQRAKTRADAEQVTLTSVINDALIAYAQAKPGLPLRNQKGRDTLGSGGSM